MQNLKNFLLAGGHALGASLVIVYRRAIAAFVLRLISGAVSLILRPQSKINSLEAEMLEGKEVDKKIGNLGSVSVDVDGNLPTIGKTQAMLNLGIDEDVLKDLPGVLKAKASLALELLCDPVLIAIHYLGKSSSPIAKFIAVQLANLRNGAEVHPALVQAAAEHEQAEAEKVKA